MCHNIYNRLTSFPRARRDKELHALTELRKLQNRVHFGVAEEEAFVGDSTKGFGLVGSGATGSVRATTSDAKLKNAIKRNKRVRALAAEVSGLSTRISFTPVQGFELKNPAMASLNKEEESASKTKYFSPNSGFQTILKKQ